MRTKYGVGVCLILALLAAGSPLAAGGNAALSFADADSLAQIREKIKLNGYSFAVKPTWVYSLPPAAKAKMFKRRTSSGKLLPVPAAASLKAAKALPAAFDWRAYEGHSYIGPVKDQGTLGSCYAFGAIAAAEGTYNYATGNYDAARADFSESYLVWSLSSLAPYGEHFGGGEGADYDYYELLALTKLGVTGKEGVCAAAKFPYQTSQPSQAVVTASFDYPRTLFKSWRRVYPANEADTVEQIKVAISTYGVVDAAVYASSAFTAYASGVYQDDFHSGSTTTPYYYTPTNHSIALVGWDDNPPEGGGGCWILRNSWGATWGEDGYMRIRFTSAYANLEATYLVYDGGSFHSADYNPADWKIDAFELLRVVTLFNNGLHYRPDAVSPDGFSPSPVAVDFAGKPYHSSDYNPADGRIDLFELLRAVTLFNNGLYYQTDTSGADGYAPSGATP